MYGKRKLGAKGGVKKRMSRKRTGTTIKSLAKAVRTLQAKTATVTERIQYGDEENIDCAQPYVIANLCNYNTWFKLWPSTGTDIAQSRNSMYHRYFSIDNNITLDNIQDEEGEVMFTYFIVSRRDTAGTATDNTNNLTLSQNVDYAQHSGKSFMNLKKWKVHYVKRFTLSGGDGAELQSDHAFKRFKATIKVNAKVTNPDGQWQALSNSPDPSDTYYAVVFNDNVTLDGEAPKWSYFCIHSVDC